jgi:hypothetical protein
MKMNDSLSAKNVPPYEPAEHAKTLTADVG